MQTMIIMLLTLSLGIMIAVYLPMNSTVARYLGSPISASIPFFSLPSLRQSSFFFYLRTTVQSLN